MSQLTNVSQWNGLIANSSVPVEMKNPLDVIYRSASNKVDRSVVPKPSVSRLSNLKTRQSLYSLSKRGVEGSAQSIVDTEPTEAQRKCAERLGVDVSECNKYGVFMNRTEQIATEILKLISRKTWDSVMPDMLAHIWNFHADSLEISSLKEFDFDGLKEVEYLYLDGNEISELPDKIFDQLTKLRYLDLSDNRLSSLPQGVFDKLTLLTTLNLGNNKLVHLSETLFKKMNDLKLLYLDHNSISEISEGMFDAQKKLISLALNDNQLYALSKKAFRNLDELSWLFLQNNRIMTLPEGLISVGYLKTLQNLLIYGNPLVISEPVFKEFQTALIQNEEMPTAQLKLGYSDPSVEDIVGINIGNFVMLLSEAKDFFQSGQFDKKQTLYIKPSQPILPKSGEGLNNDQFAFLCIYLKNLLEKDPARWASEALASCESSDVTHIKNINTGLAVGLGIGLPAILVSMLIFFVCVVKYGRPRWGSSHDQERTRLLSAPVTDENSVNSSDTQNTDRNELPPEVDYFNPNQA